MAKNPKPPANDRPHTRHLLLVGLVAFVVPVLVVAAVATAIALSQQQARSRVRTNFDVKGTTAAAFVESYVTEEGQLERTAAAQYLSTPMVSPSQFALVNRVLGFDSAALLDAQGRVIATTPDNPKLLGVDATVAEPFLEKALAGQVAVSGSLPTTTGGPSDIAIAVPFATPSGRRVYSAILDADHTPLRTSLNLVTVLSGHKVLLIDGQGHLIEAMPPLSAGTLSHLDPALATASAAASSGSYNDTTGAFDFTAASVPGTTWRVVVAVPDAELFRSSGGWQSTVSWIVLAVVAVLAAALAILLFRSMRDRRSLSEFSEKMALAARTDLLTGIPNRRYLSGVIDELSQGERRAGDITSVLMIDVDKFKSINDRFGHEVGDLAIVAVAEAMRSVLRDDDLYARWGGDEFLVVLPSADLARGQALADRIQAAVRAVDLGHDLPADEVLRLSIGCVAGTGKINDLIRRADDALYEAKSLGGDLVVSVPPETDHLVGA